VNFLEEAAITSPTDYETTVEWNKKKPLECQAGWRYWGADWGAQGYFQSHQRCFDFYCDL